MVYANEYATIKDYSHKPLKILAKNKIKAHNISIVDEKCIILGYSAKIKVVTEDGKKNPHIKQDGKQEMITLMEDVSANGYGFPTFLITKGQGSHIWPIW